MAEDFKFKGAARLENAVNFVASFSPDGEVVTLIFDDLVMDLGGPKGGRIATKVVSIAMPVETELDLKVRLRLDGFVSADEGARAAVLVHHGGETTLLDLPQGPCVEADISQDLVSTLPAGAEYRIVLFLLLERDTDDADVGGLITIDTLEPVLERVGGKSS